MHEMNSFTVPNSFENTCPGHGDGGAGFLFSQLIQTLIAAHCAFTQDYPKDYGDDLQTNEEFDFIVVGAGSSGSVIASRLSENPAWKILLLEAGGDPTFSSDIPGFLFNTQGSSIDWQFLHEKFEGSCLGMIDQKCANPRGKVLGGSSTINAMLYVRGNSQDYDEWESLGNEGWGYEKILKYFKLSQNLNGYSLVNESSRESSKVMLGHKSTVMLEKYHSVGGPLSVSPFADSALGFIRDAMFEAFKELNLPSGVDINGESQIGLTNAPGTLFKGSRANTAKMFLNNIKTRQNLFVVKRGIVKKIIIQNYEAKGVELIRNNKTYVVKSKKEVIVSAGAINSPQLLMLSGIGPEDHLKFFKIPLILNLKGVGQNLQDHVNFFGRPFSLLKGQFPTMTPLSAMDAIYMYFTGRSNIFSSIGLTDLMGFIDTKNETNVPDIQYIFVSFLKNDKFLLPEIVRVMRLQDNLKQQFLDMVKESGVIIIMPIVLKPAGRGRIELRSADINDPPKIFTDILKDKKDRETLLNGIKFISKLKETKAFQSLEPKDVRFDIPECNKKTLDTDDYWLCIMKYLSSTLYHPVGTCKMGPKEDLFSVVDNELRVHGLKNLRIADASIMPTIVRGNTNAACIMIGEKCADLIKKNWITHTHVEL